jgi:hypothetical protein
LEPAGIVKSIPGLRIMNREVVTMRSVFVRTIPKAFAIKENARKKTSAWNNTSFLPVKPSLKETLVPFVLRRTPGLRSKKSDAGKETF